MELRQIRQFVTLCETRNFHRAAESLNMSQPPLSVAMRKLEQELGTTLFERGARGVVLTAAAVSILPHARDALACVEAMHDAVDATTRGLRGRLTAGFVGSAVYGFLPKVVPAFRGQRPAIALSLREMTTLEILRGLDAGDLDVGVVRTPVFEVCDVDLELLCREEMILLLPANHPSAGRETIALEDLRDELFIGYDSTRLPDYHSLSLAACEAAGFQPRVVERAAHLHTLIALVESGIGVALAPAVSRIPGGQRIAYARLAVQGEPLMTGLALATRRNERRATIQAFAAALRAAAGQQQIAALPQ